MDLYETPAVAVESLLREVELPRAIWEPACGPGAIARVLRQYGHEVLATDLVDYASPDQDGHGVDFLFDINPDFDPAIADFSPHAIVTNPPFKLAAEFVARAMKCAPLVVMLLRLAFLESERRSPILDNGTLREVLVYRKRLPMMHRTGWEGRKANSGMAFAWFIWDRAHRGPARLHRISWDRVDGGAV
jgi:hypothetical protein